MKKKLLLLISFLSVESSLYSAEPYYAMEQQRENLIREALGLRPTSTRTAALAAREKTKDLVEKDHLSDEKYLKKVSQQSSNRINRKRRRKKSGGKDLAAWEAYSKRCDELPYACPEKGCTRRYKSEPNLRSHVRINHNGIKPHKCPHCDKCFARPSSLGDHERTHTGERPFQCSICSEKFSRKDVGNNHKKKRHGGRGSLIDTGK